MEEEEELDVLISNIKKKREHILIYREIINSWDNLHILQNMCPMFNSHTVKNVLSIMPGEVRKHWDLLPLKMKINILEKNISIFYSDNQRGIWFHMYFYDEI